MQKYLPPKYFQTPFPSLPFPSTLSTVLTHREHPEKASGKSHQVPGQYAPEDPLLRPVQSAAQVVRSPESVKLKLRISH